MTLNAHAMPVHGQIAKDASDATHRLKNLEVFEVSLVDRPANKRTFIVVKNAENKMPKGKELTPDADGVLHSAEKAGFKPERKKAIKSALTSARKAIDGLLGGLDDSDDEGSVMKGITGVTSVLSKLGGGFEDKPKDKDADKKTEKEESAAKAPDFRDELLDAVETDLEGALKTSENTIPGVTKSDLAEVNMTVKSLASTVQTLVGVVRTQTSSKAKGARPASQAGAPGETITQNKSARDPWQRDMNATPDPDDQF